eukprot:RCo022614
MSRSSMAFRNTVASPSESRSVDTSDNLCVIMDRSGLVSAITPAAASTPEGKCALLPGWRFPQWSVSLVTPTLEYSLFALGIVALYYVSQYSFLLFHAIAELFS